MPHTPGHSGTWSNQQQQGAPGFQTFSGWQLQWLQEQLVQSGSSFSDYGITNMGDMYDYTQQYADYMANLDESGEASDEWWAANEGFQTDFGAAIDIWWNDWMPGAGETGWAGVTYDPDAEESYGFEEGVAENWYSPELWYDLTGEIGGSNVWMGGGNVGGAGDLGLGSSFAGGSMGNALLNYMTRGMDIDCDAHPWGMYNSSGQCIACCPQLEAPQTEDEGFSGGGGGSIGDNPMQQGPPKPGMGAGPGMGVGPGMGAGPGNVGQPIDIFSEVQNANRGPNTLANQIRPKRRR